MEYNLLERRRGDTYPMEYNLSRAGIWVLTGSTVKMTFIFEDEVVHTFTGTILSEDEKLVKFEPTSAAVADVRSGKYDIQVDDGTYIATHIKGIVSIIEDVTP